VVGQRTRWGEELGAPSSSPHRTLRLIRLEGPDDADTPIRPHADTPPGSWILAPCSYNRCPSFSRFVSRYFSLCGFAGTRIGI
jgi:hypothetical protein